MSQGTEHKEQAFAALACAFVATTCGQPGLSIIFRDSGIVVGGLLTILACTATALQCTLPQIEKRIANPSFAKALGFIRRRFILVTICIVVSICPIFLARFWPVNAASPTRLVLIFHDSSIDPDEKISSNVHWSSWSGLQEEKGARRRNGDNVLRDEDMTLNAHDVTVLFLRFDTPVDCDRFKLTMADWSRIPDTETRRKDGHTAVLVIHGRVKREVEMTIEPAPAGSDRV